MYGCQRVPHSNFYIGTELLLLTVYKWTLIITSALSAYNFVQRT